ncbi:MAG: FkbM family methyltransferase [Calditrichaeota bacterium]|nr:FkbM family methyltransferase [Calditrichota bacterium]
MANFLKTLRSFRRNPYLSTSLATWRHVAWQARKLMHGFPVVIEREGIRLRIQHEVRNGVGGLFNGAGFWDANNMRLVRELASRSLVRNFVDIGANVGVYSLIAGKHVPVIAFEPHPSIHRQLIENCDLNGLQNRIQIIQAALGDTNGEVKFTDELGSSINRVVTESENGAHAIPVTIHRADSWFAFRHVSPSLVKIDVEGHEDHVLEGFGELLSRVDIVLVECRKIGQAAQIARSAGLLGPCSYVHSTQRFHARRMHGEDWVFINHVFMKQLADAGFHFDAELLEPAAAESHTDRGFRLP